MGADFEQFYAANVHALTIQIYAYTGDMDQSQDLAHEAFIRALPRWNSLAGYDDPMAWLRRVAWNLATSRWRRARAATAYLRRQRPEHVDRRAPTASRSPQRWRRCRCSSVAW